MTGVCCPAKLPGDACQAGGVPFWGVPRPCALGASRLSGNVLLRSCGRATGVAQQLENGMNTSHLTKSAHAVKDMSAQAHSMVPWSLRDIAIAFLTSTLLWCHDWPSLALDT